MKLKKVEINATTLPDAWFLTIQACVDKGRIYTVTEGSYEGQKRKELDWLTVHIRYPHERPLLPDVPPGMKRLNPVPGGMDYITNDYLPYLMTDEKKEGEAYTYGQRLFGSEHPHLLGQVEEVIEKYKRGFGNNQCSMTVARPTDVHLIDPPCLRHIDTRIFTDEQREGPPELHFFPYFRSWDAYAGLPSNLAAIVFLQEYMAEAIGNGVKPGEIVATSKGVHLYDLYWKLAKERLG